MVVAILLIIIPVNSVTADNNWHQNFGQGNFHGNIATGHENFGNGHVNIPTPQENITNGHVTIPTPQENIANGNRNVVTSQGNFANGHGYVGSGHGYNNYYYHGNNSSNSIIITPPLFSYPYNYPDTYYYTNPDTYAPPATSAPVYSYYDWVWSDSGDVPDNAIIYQYQNNAPIFYCRAYVEGDFYDGYLVPNDGCYADLDGQSTRFELYQVYVGEY